MSLRNEEARNIEAMLIIEVIGKPPEHLIETLEAIIKRIDEEKGVRVVRKDIKEPVLMKEQTEFYTTFAEIEVEVEEILHLAILMFKYMPAHIEIANPELIALTNNGWNDIFNELTRRLHGYDEIARILQTEKAILEGELRKAVEQQKTNKDEKESNMEDDNSKNINKPEKSKKELNKKKSVKK